MRVVRLMSLLLISSGLPHATASFLFSLFIIKFGHGEKYIIILCTKIRVIKKVGCCEFLWVCEKVIPLFIYWGKNTLIVPRIAKRSS